MLHCQICWADFLQQYDFDIKYIKGKENTVEDTLSQYPYHLLPSEAPIITTSQPTETIATILEIKTDSSLLKEIVKDCRADEWCRKLKNNMV